MSRHRHDINLSHTWGGWKEEQISRNINDMCYVCGFPLLVTREERLHDLACGYMAFRDMLCEGPDLVVHSAVQQVQMEFDWVREEISGGGIDFKRLPN